jgi:hypothetical protein
MRKNTLTLLTVCAAMMSIAIAGCGSSGSSNSPSTSQASKSTVFGVASLGTTVNGTVSVKDSSVPVQEKTAAIGSNGTYTLDVSRLKSPFLLKAAWTDREGNKRMYSASTRGGRTNINPLSDAAVNAAADGRDPDELFARGNHDDDERTAGKFEEVLNSLRTVLAPLFALYQTSGNMVSDDYEGEDDGDDGDEENSDTGLRTMFRDVRFEVKDGMLTVTNRQTGGVIFTGSLNDLASGTFSPANMPGAPETGGGGTTTPPPAACNFTYDAWGACQPNNTQTRNLLSSSPAGCTGTPVLSQACTYGSSAPACGTCHAIPPATGQHSFHVTSMGFTCDRCHGTGYSSTTVNAATHNNGVKDVVSGLNFNATTRSCSPGCHGTRSW